MATNTFLNMSTHLDAEDELNLGAQRALQVGANVLPLWGRAQLSRSREVVEPVAMKVEAVMSRPMITVRPEASVKHAARLLVDRGISALPVVDAAGRLVGIVSEADLLAME